MTTVSPVLMNGSNLSGCVVDETQGLKKTVKASPELRDH